MKVTLPVLSEDQEQIAFVGYLESRGLRFTAIPNSTYTTHMNVKMRNHRLGVRAGFPDMIVVLPGVGLACVEMKRTKNSTISPHQKEWIGALNTVPNVEARVCKGYEKAREFIEELYPSSVYKPDLSF